MKKLPIVWKRLVKDGETCERCGATRGELDAALIKLAAALRPLGIEPVLETREIDDAEFRADPSESNRVWIAGRPIEDWLAANVGRSRCCSVCGDSDCRTLEIGGRIYETIPEAEFIRAGLLAGSQMIAPPPLPHASTPSCCSSNPVGSSGAPTPERSKTGCCG